MKRLVFLLPLVVLSGCVQEVCPSAEQLFSTKIEQIEQNIISNTKRIEVIEIDQIKQGTMQNQDNKICVGIRNISINDEQAKKLFECVGNNDGGYCNCIEKYASCTLASDDIPQEYKDDFNPECLHNE